MTRVLALPKYGPAAASTRQRLLQFLPALESAGFAFAVRPLLDDDYVRSLAGGAPVPKVRIGSAYIDRLKSLSRPVRAEMMWVYAELFPGLPALAERLVHHAGLPYIYDCDDAFFHQHERHWHLRDKLRPLVERAAVVTAGNDYLASQLSRWSDRVHVVPTVVDTDRYRPARRGHDAPPTIGWIGSPSTWAYVRPLLPLLAGICGEGRARFLAVGAGTAAERDRFDGMDLRNWSEDSEIGDVQSMDIGIMPLPDEPFARGKCGYKLIQYMACGLPVVASPIGVNRTIVVDGATGLLPDTSEAWRGALDLLLSSADLRGSYGQAGRDRAERLYSLRSQQSLVVNLFEQVRDRSLRHKDRPSV